MATGLAVTGTGGDVLFVEATAMPGESGLAVTGQLGDVMKESSEIALSYVRSHTDALGLAADTFEKRKFHVHVPAGAVPKDGPSAGVTMACALVSLLTGQPVRREVAMTGEITLRGRVLPVGGLKEKLLAALRAGVTEVIVPADNARDLDELAQKELRGLHIVLPLPARTSYARSAALAEGKRRPRTRTSPSNRHQTAPARRPSNCRTWTGPSGPRR